MSNKSIAADDESRTRGTVSKSGTSARHSSTIEAEQLTLFSSNECLYEISLATSVASIVAATAAVWIVWGTELTSAASTWLACFWLVGVVRGLDSRDYQLRAKEQRKKMASHYRLRFCTGLILTALMWAIFTPTFFGYLDVHTRASLGMILAAMAGGSSVALGAAPGLALIMVGAQLLPFSGMFLIGTQQDATLGALGAIYFVALIGIIYRSHHSLTSAVFLSSKNETLMLDAIQQQRKMLMLNKKLSRAKQSLIAMNQRLEEKVRKRTLLLQKEIDERESYRQRLERLASRDPLTGLSNRGRFSRMLALSLDTARDANQKLAVLFIDLDRFKEVNDGLGHPVGDQVLKIVARRLLDSKYSPICAARWGGDEFVTVHSLQDGQEHNLERFAQSIVAELSRDMPISGNTLRIGASIGIAIYPEHGTNADTLIQHADIAVYEAKESGRGLARVFRSEWQTKAGDRHRMMQALKDALSNSDLQMFYQPIVDPTNGKVQSMEALMRWNHPELGSVQPSEFIPLAEENGLMVGLGAWGLKRACSDAVQLIGEYCSRVSVNVSVHQFAHGDFVSLLDEALQASGLNPINLELELTETIYARDPSRVLQTLQAVRQRGVRIAIDDFGTGYSSLAYLQRFPVDILKVDRSFVQDMDRGGDRIISAVTSLARNLGVKVVAEGVETVEQLRKVRILGADFVQGYLFAKPMQLADAIDWLGQHQLRTLATNPKPAAKPNIPIAEPAKQTTNQPAGYQVARQSRGNAKEMARRTKAGQAS